MKIGTIFLLAMVTCLLILGGIWQIAYDWQSRLQKQIQADELYSPVQIRWGELNTAEIHSDSFSDALFALGYVQGQLNGWTIALWRQAALGKLSDWYGGTVVDADRLIHQLGLPEIAKQTGNQLSPEDARLMAAFGAGIEDAWQDSEHMHEFFLQNIKPQPWELWHSLAIERLIAWMSVEPDATCNLGESVCKGIETLRSTLLIQGLESSSSWAISTSRGPFLYQRHILGKGIPPLFQEVILKVSNELDVRGATLLGTPFFTAGKQKLMHGPFFCILPDP